MEKQLFYVPKDLHSRLIGKGGATMKELTAMGCSVDVPKREDPSNVITVTGSAASNARVKARMESELGFPVATEPIAETRFTVPESEGGRLVGKGGATLKDIQTTCGVSFVLPRGAGEGILVGSDAGVRAAVTKIEALLGRKLQFTAGTGGRGGERPQIGATLPVVVAKKDLRRVANELLVFPDADSSTFQTFLSYLESATKSIDVSVYTISDDRISNLLIAASKVIKVRVVSDKDTLNNKGSDIDRIARAGIEVRVNATGLMHHKFAVLDGCVVLNGSFNWTSTAARDNCENVMVTADTTFVNAFSRLFEGQWRDFSANVYRPGLQPAVSRELRTE